MITFLSSTQINNPHFSKAGKMRDYGDSPSFKEHPLFRDDPNALQIQLYYDDVEVVNPLGGNTKVHKLSKQHGIKLHACNTAPIHNLSVQMQYLSLCVTNNPRARHSQLYVLSHSKQACFTTHLGICPQSSGPNVKQYTS